MYLICFLATLLISLSSAAPYGSSYGSVAAPVLTAKPVVSFDHSSFGYGSGYAVPQQQQQIVQKDIVMPVAPTYTQTVSKPVVSFDQSYTAAPAPVVFKPTPVFQADTTSYSAVPVVVKPVVQLDSSYNAAPVVQAVKPVVQFESHQSYNAVPVAPVMQMEVITEAPEFRELCLSNKNAYGVSVSRTVFYLPHPTKQSNYIQCDEFGKAFLKECPAGTIFTLNLACENINDLHEIVDKTVPVAVPQLDQTVGTYGSAPVFAADQTHVETARIEVITEAPEFRELCANKQNAYGVQVSSNVFYLPHPTKQSFYIQCDEFGKSFLKECPAGTIFTANLACEKIDEIHTAETVVAPVPIVKPVMENHVLTSSLSYNTAPVLSADQTQIVNTQIDIVHEAPEFKEMCLKSRTTGVAVFYMPHPTKQTFFVQCDEFGSAFLKECPVNTIFTMNLICENINDLHAIETKMDIPVAAAVVPQFDQTVGSYGAAPVFTQVQADQVQHTEAHVEVIVEAPEFDTLCMNKNAYGAQISSTLFYIPHPTIKRDYIQCNEFGKAFLKECPIGTVFTHNLVCEIEEPVVTEPVSIQTVQPVESNVILTSSSPVLSKY